MVSTFLSGDHTPTTEEKLVRKQIHKEVQCPGYKCISFHSSSLFAGLVCKLDVLLSVIVCQSVGLSPPPLTSANKGPEG